MKAIILLSGGLDSTIAAELASREGLELLALTFKTPFCLCDSRGPAGCGCSSLRVARRLGIQIRFINAGKEFLDVVRNPEHGYGSHLNPCLDCRILFFRKSAALMREVGASFIITGEVLGQRPMSQMRRQMDIIARESGLEGLVVRPLSAKLLPPTVPETKGWIRREWMLDIAGRSRKQQIAVATEMGLHDYPCAAGGCLLTDPGFARRMRDLIAHGQFDLSGIELAKAGRYFRLPGGALLLVGRNEEENRRLEALAGENDLLVQPAAVNGPVAVGRGAFDAAAIERACRIVARYCDRGETDRADISWRRAGSGEGTVRVRILDEQELAASRV